VTRRLVLFDIDGTLLSAGGVSGRCLAEALREVFGTTGPMEGYDFSGKTDPQIVRDLMTAAGFPGDEIDGRLPTTLGSYHARMVASLRPTHVVAKVGVAALVDRLSAEASVTLALLTGNLEPCARLKLAPLDLNDRFAFGAFGSDHEDRHRLPSVAVDRALAATGHRFEGKRIVVVGDSIHDVRCGRDLGVRAVAVSSGRTSAEALAREEPDALLRDFGDTNASLDAILG
jgi:phosphoglycolate phosphatase